MSAINLHSNTAGCGAHGGLASLTRSKHRAQTAGNLSHSGRFLKRALFA